MKLLYLHCDVKIANDAVETKRNANKTMFVCSVNLDKLRGQGHGEPVSEWDPARTSICSAAWLSTGNRDTTDKQYLRGVILQVLKREVNIREENRVRRALDYTHSNFQTKPLSDILVKLFVHVLNNHLLGGSRLDAIERWHGDRWKGHHLAHVCQRWRHILYVSPHRLTCAPSAWLSRRPLSCGIRQTTRSPAFSLPRNDIALLHSHTTGVREIDVGVTSSVFEGTNVI